jgi:hypothetical protein
MERKFLVTHPTTSQDSIFSFCAADPLPQEMCFSKRKCCLCFCLLFSLCLLSRRPVLISAVAMEFVEKIVLVFVFKDGAALWIAPQVYHDRLTELLLTIFYFVVTCPNGVSWVDRPYNGSVSHQLSECSGVGDCDRTSATCECYPGYTGDACQRSASPQSPYLTVIQRPVQMIAMDMVDVSHSKTHQDSWGSTMT